MKNGWRAAGADGVLRRWALRIGGALAASAVLVLGGCGVAAQPTSKNPAAVGWLPAGVTPIQLVFAGGSGGDEHLGVGGEWDPGFWQPFNVEAGVTEADWQVVCDRLKWMRPGFVRMMMQVKWCCPDGKTFDFDTPQMRSLYRHLDFCEQQKITVILTDWGCEPEWLKVPGIADVGDPKYAAAIGRYMEHLIKDKKYSCIRYFVMVNEPNLEVKDWARWKKGLLQVSAEFLRHRWDGRSIGLVGADESGNEEWHRKAVNELSDTLTLFDIHRYTTLEELTSGRLETLLKEAWKYGLEPVFQDGQKRKIPARPPRRMIVGEAGLFTPGFSASNNPLHESYDYGVYMADYAVQALCARMDGVSAWMFDDSSHPNFTWGMWRNKAGGQALKPWFYTWALLCRCVPPGAEIMGVGVKDEPAPPARVNQTFDTTPPRSHGLPPGLRGFVAYTDLYKAPPAKPEWDGWTACLVNRGGTPVAVRVPVPSYPPRPRFSSTVYVYEYSPARRTADAQGFPTPVAVLEMDSTAGCDLLVPANAVVIATTVAPE